MTPASRRLVPPRDRALVAAEQYWVETRRPFPSLLFLAPLLIAYEVGVLWLGDGRDELLRNGADAWMRAWLYAAGLHQSFVLPLVVIGLLLIWNFYGYFTWRVRPETLGGMLAESLIFAFALVVAAQASELLCRRAGLATTSIHDSTNPLTSPLQPLPVRTTHGVDPNRGIATAVTAPPRLLPLSLVSEAGRAEFPADTARSPAAPPVDAESASARTEVHSPIPRRSSFPAREAIARATTFIGAGIYEEVLFRLLLLPACYAWFRLWRAGPKASATLAVLATSLMFALAHYIGPAGDTLVPYTFCFRAAAGAYFAILFVTRGFGITVGTHALYDLIVGVLWATA